MHDAKDIFLHPTLVTHRKYEALRALCVDEQPAKEVAKLFDYSIFTVNAMKRDFIQAVKNNQFTPDDFFVIHSPGRHPDKNKEPLKNKIIQLRKQNHSILDIKATLNTEGHRISHDYIHKTLREDGFERLPKRTQLERKLASVKTITAPTSTEINWQVDNGVRFASERGIGILTFLPLLASLDIQKWITTANYPGTSNLDCVQSILSFIALKLSGHKRYHQDDLWAMDRGFGLFSGLNVLPKTTTLATYSYRVARVMNRRFLQAMNTVLAKANKLSGTVNMDFTAIPHWGDASVLENNWSGKRRHALKSVLALLCQDPDSGLFCYSDAEVKHAEQYDCVLQFVDFWRENGGTLTCLIFDSKFTTYQNLEKLDADKIKFITLRRRSKNMISKCEQLPKDEWKMVVVEGIGRKHRRLKVHESEIFLPKLKVAFRQLIITGNGHEQPTFLITNDRKKTAAQIIRQYGKRWNVEKGISEQIEFFHLNSLSSSVVVKVDFDLTMTVVAHNLYRLMANYLPGFEKETAESLNVKFFTNGGHFTIQKDKIIVELKKKRYLPHLVESLNVFANNRITWLGNRKIMFTLTSAS